jgi:hypothetical protein
MGAMSPSKWPRSPSPEFCSPISCGWPRSCGRRRSHRCESADVTGVGAWEPSCRGFGIARILKSGNFTAAKAVIRWMSAKATCPRRWSQLSFCHDRLVLRVDFSGGSHGTTLISEMYIRGGGSSYDRVRLAVQGFDASLTDRAGGRGAGIAARSRRRDARGYGAGKNRKDLLVLEATAVVGVASPPLVLEAPLLAPPLLVMAFTRVLTPCSLIWGNSSPLNDSGCGRQPFPVRASRAPMARRRAVSTTERMSA